MKKEIFTFKFAKILTGMLCGFIGLSIIIFLIILGIEKSRDDWLPIISFVLAPNLLFKYFGFAHPTKIEIDQDIITLYYFGIPKIIFWDSIQKFYPQVYVDKLSYKASKHYILSSKQLNIFHWILGFFRGKRFPITYISVENEEHYRLIKIIQSKLNNISVLENIG
jgi:hypothetical protein